ncbi:hypothetical protein BN2364_3019 [Alloalcanivorax xenomutans]|nr:hypothetical protein BN2364_3019 [Alloalcanivorax xenomutans]
MRRGQFGHGARLLCIADGEGFREGLQSEIQFNIEINVNKR